MTTPEKLQLTAVIVQAIGLCGTLIAAILALKTYRRNERWKRAEFLAGEMKEFLSNEGVQRALLLIDWGTRAIKLLDDKAPDGGVVVVTRPMQVRGLLPHVLLRADKGSDVALSGNGQHFSPAEAAIRDTYDVFLDGLERIASYVRSGLVSAEALEPYLAYWLNDIYVSTADPEDAAWSAALLTYIDYYHFNGVQWLFAVTNRPIDPASPRYREFLARMQDQALARQLASSVQAPYATAEQSASSEARATTAGR
jgi:hypothetical protein